MYKLCLTPACPLLPTAALHSVIFCEAVAIYGVIVAIILQTKIDTTPMMKNDVVFDKYAMHAGYAIFGSGITCGFANLVCG